MPDFTTGPSELPDIGTLFYNGCTFSSLFQSSISGQVIKDNANRTTKYMEYEITVDGYVTLEDGADDIDGNTQDLRTLLTAQGGRLAYKGRGMDIVVNQPGNPVKDVAWGPIPQLLEFQPLGGGLSAKVVWKVKTMIPELQANNGKIGPVLQFNEETNVSYDEAGYSQISIRGTLEIPLTRITQDDPTVPGTVDTFRSQFLNGLGIDLTRFRPTKRDVNISRDRRTMEWAFDFEELPYMGMPPTATLVRGNYNVRPARAGMGLVSWLCTLRCTYTIRKDKARRNAWLAFLALLRVRMRESNRGFVPVGNNQNPNPNRPNFWGGIGNAVIATSGIINQNPLLFMGNVLQQQPISNAAGSNDRKAFLIDLNFDEGLYLDSRTITFSATWKLITTFSEILLASGLWKKVDSDGGGNWAISVQDISGANSWLTNRVDADVIVDFGHQT